jgi:hypothetical protein
MRPEDTSSQRPASQDTPQLLVESQFRAASGTTGRFLRAARHLAASGRPATVFLIDDAVRVAVGSQPSVTGILAAGGQVWADEDSLAARAIPASQLVPGVVTMTLDKVAPLLFDPAVQVVWH